MKLIIVLPAFNEALSLPPLLARIDHAFTQFQWKGEVIVVNDGSTDTTLKVASNFNALVPIRVIDLQPNGGLAGAIRAGLNAAISVANDPLDIVVTLDADDSQNPFLIERMLHQIYEGSDLVIASRYQQGARIHGLTASRKLFSWAAGMLFRVFVGFPGVRDYTCGFRAYKASFLKRVMDFYGETFITQQGFGCMVEILLKIGVAGAIMHEAPMILRYDLKQGASKMNVKKTIRQTLVLLYQYRMGKLIRNEKTSLA